MAKTVFNRNKVDFTKQPMFFGEDQNTQRYDTFKFPEFDKLNTEISYIIGVPYLIVSFEEVANLNLDQLCCFFIAQFWLTYDLKEIEFETRSPGLIRLLEKSSLLSQIDIAWKSHLQKMDILRDSIGWRSYGQLDPLLEYKNEAFNLFIDTTREIKYNAIYNVLKSRIV